jgi:hypothetical protein
MAAIGFYSELALNENIYAPVTHTYMYKFACAALMQALWRVYLRCSV